VRAVPLHADTDLCSCLRDRLGRLYGPSAADDLARRACAAIDQWRPRMPAHRVGFDARDSLLITYADMLHHPDEAPLATLKRFLDEQLAGVISAVHLLPFYPWSSDDGFSVIDYRSVEPGVGTWSDVEALSERFELAFDLVLNHVSARSAWFELFLAGERDLGL
jgi:glucosylglycerate phosphorylase